MSDLEGFDPPDWFTEPCGWESCHPDCDYCHWVEAVLAAGPPEEAAA